MGKVFTDIDACERSALGWLEKTKQGDKAVRIAIRKVLVRYGLPASGKLFTVL
ncbi:hypothetical protein [Pseudarthrobacter enclensis]|uniref:hypothetical protein n=1 Tax=Pseudarthrobacter enclensis TaxID=993070 RepID=UPI000ADD618B|nr:hypothetical protein [Pseudarthrobacter enclensis]